MNWLIVVAGGGGERARLGYNKIFAKLHYLPLIYWTLKIFESSKIIDNIIISAREKDIKKIKAIIAKYKFKKTGEVIEASHSRQASTFKVLEAISSKVKKDDLVGVHNAVNPFVREDEIEKVYRSAKLYGAALLAQAARDTVKITNGKGLVCETPLRQNAWYAQTPQVATFANMYKAHMKAKAAGFAGTDDAQLLERVGIRPKIVPCSNLNFKITFREDLVMAEQIIRSWRAQMQN